VQRALFEEVCDVASEQLLLLSNNRYILTLDAEDAKKIGRTHGLDLYIIDSDNGQHRSVETLSGGEQFITALSLALAMAEVVQRHAGGIELSSLFIDEGFGNLDADSRDAAVEVLTKLQNAGRTVGIVTHITEMQQQLPAAITIHKTKGGSTLIIDAD
jgi:exonuclease SbcC